jgi:predicted ATP-grasp superfamily ATP-dependent carboligase
MASLSITILAPSGRAMAQSGARAGLTVHVADLFGDRDTRETAQTVVVDGSPQRWKDFLASTPVDQPWMYGGGFENHADLVGELSEMRPLLGTEHSYLGLCRDPCNVQETVREAGFPSLEIRDSGRGLPRDGSWLRKSMYSTGGHGVSVWDEDNDQAESAEGIYFQPRIQAPVCSGLYLASDRGCRLVGVTEQLEGCSWLRAKPFHYSGSMGPLYMEPAPVEWWTRLGTQIASQFQLKGLFGLDCLTTPEPNLIDVNPRYPASAELYEFAGEPSLVAQHIAACHNQLSIEELSRPPTLAQQSWVKGIIFAQDELFVTESLSDELFARSKEGLVRYADIPQPGTPVPAQDPILTIIRPLGGVDSNDKALQEPLRQEAEALERLVFGRRW